MLLTVGEERTLSERLYLDAVDVFCRFLPDPLARERLAAEMAYTMNLSKEQTNYIATTYKPNISLTAAALQVCILLFSCVL
jgi:hypothetical protein